MFKNRNNRNKLVTIMWMGVGSALLSSIFSSVIIRKVVTINEKITNIQQELFHLNNKQGY